MFYVSETAMPHYSSSEDEDQPERLVILLDHPDDEYVEINLVPTTNQPAETIIVRV